MYSPQKRSDFEQIWMITKMAEEGQRKTLRHNCITHHFLRVLLKIQPRGEGLERKEVGARTLHGMQPTPGERGGMGNSGTLMPDWSLGSAVEVSPSLMPSLLPLEPSLMTLLQILQY